MIETAFNPSLVTLSIIVAVFASYVALNLAHSVTQAQGRERALWLSCGALALGIGIWSMHFIGMLAFEMPGMEMAYDVPLVALSVVVAILGSALALFITSRETVAPRCVFVGGVAMAAAIAGMHYIGMYSMRMWGAIDWNLFYVFLSIVIALVASWGALVIAVQMRNRVDHFWTLIGSSVIMGFAIAGMHYMGMHAATFYHSEDALGINNSNLMVTSGLSAVVVSATLLILGLALATSIGRRMWEKKSRRADAKLVKSEERFRHLVEAVKDYAIYMVDLEGRVTTWNKGGERITGYTEKEIVGKHQSINYLPADAGSHAYEKELAIARETGQFEGEGPRRKKDGSAYWASVVVNPLYDEDGHITGYSKVVRDITALREAEQRLRRSHDDLENRVRARTHDIELRENQLRQIANAVPVLIAQIDRNEIFTFANDAFSKWFGMESAQLLGKSFHAILGPKRYPTNKAFLDRAFAGFAVTFERSSDYQHKKILGVTFMPEIDREHQVTGIIIVASDITQHKEIQNELRQAKDAAEIANATKSAFLANMSHEIRTPLGAVLGFSELLLAGDMSPSERNASVEVIKRNGRLLSNIINDILDLSKVEAGKLDVEKIDVPLDEVIQAIGETLHAEAKEKGVELKVAAEGIIPAQIHTDPLRLRQILVNIVGNAVKFTNRGTVDVRIKLLHTNDAATKLGFIVRDTGEGIKNEQIERLFTPFMQADVSTTRKFGGTGLGLVLSRKLARALGGDVVLNETAPGRGSVFIVTIDPGHPENILFHTVEPKLKVVPNGVEALDSLKSHRILIADDNIDNQTMVMRILRLAGAQVEVANNGRESVEMAMKGDYSLVLMDLQMPEMDGYEATRILREKGFKKPIIALTAHAMKEERQRTLRGGFTDHVTKPIDRDALVRTLSGY